MMNENAKLWVEALRSGKYEQCTRVLHVKDDGYCCLGVACEVFIRAGNSLPINIDRDPGPLFGDDSREIVVYGGASKVLPRVVQDWLGLSNSKGKLQKSDKCLTCLTYLNDSGTSFNTIADIIESEPPGLFK